MIISTEISETFNAHKLYFVKNNICNMYNHLHCSGNENTGFHPQRYSEAVVIHDDTHVVILGTSHVLSHLRSFGLHDEYVD